MTILAFDPIQARKSAAELDALADRVEQALRTEGTAIDSVEPAGQEEVSHRAARSMRETGRTFHQAGLLGVRELRTAAAALRDHCGHMERTERHSAAALGSGK